MADDLAPRLIERLDEIDAAWLEATLRAGGHDARVCGFALAPIGAGNVSDTVRVTLEAEGDAPASLVVKLRPADPGAHAHGVGSGAYVRETGAYRLFAANPGGCRTPRVLSVAGDAENINLVMEDLSRTTRAGDQIAGCSVADAHAVARELARLHRRFAPLSDADAPDWAIRMPEAGDYWVPVLERAVPQVAERFADTLPAHHIALVAAAAEVTRTWHDLRHPMMTITHGDPRVDNVLFAQGADSPEAILLDWQVTGVRNPMHDLGYFLSGSIPVADRRTHERAILATYAEAFGRDDYPPDAIEADYREQLFSGLATTAAAVALLPSSPPVDRLLLTLLERNCAAVEDWDTIGALRRRA